MPSKPTHENPDNQTSSENPKDTDSRVAVESDFSSLDLPPSGGNPEKLSSVIELISSGGGFSTADITNEIDLSKRSIQRAISYGEALGFIIESDEGYSLTEEGYELALTSNETEIEELFFESIKSYDAYRILLNLLVRNSESDLDGNVRLTQPSALKELRTTLGFTESKESTLKSAVNTMFQTVTAAGTGKYIQGQGGNPTRIELTQNEFERLSESVPIEPNDEFNPEENTETTDPDLDGTESEQNKPKVGEETNLSKPEQHVVEGVIKKVSSSSEKDQSESDDERGPALRISRVRIQNFRNIRDTGFFELEAVTTLIGKNESGKTSTLEAIASFSEDHEYEDSDLPNSITKRSIDGNLPIITLEFKINQDAAESFYPHLPADIEYPITITQTKYSDGSYTSDMNSSIQERDIELPSPDILYYENYDLISDKATIKQIKNGERDTFRNLLQLSGLDLEDLQNQEFTLYNAIEDAENEVENKINEVWSQKTLNIKIRWESDSETIHLLIQDRLDSESIDNERSLTYPSQRSEGFKWFFSFYINLLAESDSSEKECKVLLLDDPAVYLHPEGKRDWLNSVNEIGKHEQVIFSSHSPYLIDKRYPSRILAVEDTPSGGTKINADIFGSDQRTFEPIRNALGIDLGSSPFVSRRQILVEGPTEYYAVSAVANYFTNVLNRDLFGWQEVSIMPVRGAPDVIGKASWLASEGIDYAIMLDSDAEGQGVKERIENHHRDIDNNRIVMLENEGNEEDIVTEDMFSPEFYVDSFNEVYEDYTSELDEEFTPAKVEDVDGISWEVSGISYDGTRLDLVLEEYLHSQEVSTHLEDSNGNIDLMKRQIGERIASRLNNSSVDESHLSAFNRLFSRIDAAIEYE